MAKDGPAGMGEATQELYGMDPDDFVAGRNELVRRLRKDGQRELAAEVAKLRRPSRAAWAVNQLARRHRADLEQLVRVGEELRAAQEGALAGAEPAELRRAARARRDAVARLAEAAELLLSERGAAAGAHASEVAATLDAASLDGDAAQAVLEGRLSSELQPPSGFGVADVPIPEPRARAEPQRTSPADASPERAGRGLKEAEDAAAEAKDRWEERSGLARMAVERVAEIRRAVQDAEAEVARLEGLLAEAERRLHAAVRDAEHAEDAASRAEDATAKAAARLRAADERVAELRGS